MSRLNSEYLLDFATAQQLVYKLSDNTLRRQYINELIKLRDDSADTHATNNYLVSMKQIIHKARIAIDNNLDINEINKASSGFNRHNDAYASAYPIQTISPEQETNPENNFRKNRPKDQFRGTKRRYQEINEPINMDARGDLRYDWKGNPIDLSHQEPKRMKFNNPRIQNKVSALYTSSNKPKETFPGRGQKP